MSRQRTINDQIWRSNRLSGCTVEDRYALFYFLTSPFSNVIGAYEVVLRVAASEMGWDVESQLINVIRRLVDADLIYFDADANYIWVKVWWDHNSAKMAVASTLRKKTLQQIEALPERWRNDYVDDFINRLPADDPLRDTVASALASPSDRVSTAYADPSDSQSSIHSAPHDALINQGVSEPDTLCTPYPNGMDTPLFKSSTRLHAKENIMAPFYVITLVPVVTLCLAIYRFWACARRLSPEYYRELLRRAPLMRTLDVVAIGMAAFTAYYAAMGWFGFTLPFIDEEPLPPWMNIILSAVTSIACVGIVWINAPNRFTQPTWGGMRESVVRTLAALRIIEAAEVAHALDIINAREAHK